MFKSTFAFSQLLMVRKGNPQQVISRHMHLSLQHTGSGAQPPEGTGDMSPQLLEPPEWSHSKTDKSFCKGSITELCREEKGGEGKEGEKKEGEGKLGKWRHGCWGIDAPGNRDCLLYTSPSPRD